MEFLKVALRELDISSPYSVAIAGVAVILTIIYFTLKEGNLPPGPRGLPYFGLFPHLSHDQCHLQLEEYARKYGDIFSFTYMGNLIINLGSVKAMREVQVQKADYFEDRFTRFNILSYTLGKGVSMVNGEPWKVLRKFFVQSFKEYGMLSLKDSAEGPVHASLKKITEDLYNKKGKSFNIIELLVERCGGTMRRITFGNDGVTDEELRTMNESYAVVLDGMTGTKMLFIGPFARQIFRFLPSYRICLTQHKVLRNALYKVCRRIESNYDQEHPTNVVEHFYTEKNDRRRKNDATVKYFTDDALIESVSQFIGDGIIAVAYFIGCFLYALVEHPEEQDKLFKEIQEVIGSERLPTLEDRSRMPYTNAFINEVVRTSNFFPLFPSLECTKEVTVRGYRIPKGAITLLNFWSANHDPNTFQNPYDFNPENYVTKSGKPRPELPTLFGMGRRACTGEPLIMVEVFLFLTGIIQKFRIAEAENPKSKSSLFLMTGNMELRFLPRSGN